VKKNIPSVNTITLNREREETRGDVKDDEEAKVQMGKEKSEMTFDVINIENFARCQTSIFARKRVAFPSPNIPRLHSRGYFHFESQPGEIRKYKGNRQIGRNNSFPFSFPLKFSSKIFLFLFVITQ
jgi:hypothetical protein